MYGADFEGDDTDYIALRRAREAARASEDAQRRADAERIASADAHLAVQTVRSALRFGGGVRSGRWRWPLRGRAVRE